MKWILIALILTQSMMAMAALGDNEKTVEKDAQVLKGFHQLSSTANYRVHQIQTSTYTAKEFVSQSGDVFAVTWEGIRHPDLSVLLGSHYLEYKNNYSKLPKIPGHRSTEVKTTLATIKQFGHSSDIRGLAYIASLVPSNVKVGDLK